MTMVPLCLITAGATPVPIVAAEIAYASKGDIWICSSTGTSKRQITFDGKNLHPDISPDGKRVAFFKVAKTFEQGTGYSLWIEDLQNGKARKIFGTSKRFVFEADWSPNGKWMVCSATTPTSLSHSHHDSPCNGEIWLVPTHVGKPRLLIEGAENSYRGRSPDFRWSPASRQILWWNTDFSENILHIVDLKGNDRELPFKKLPAGASLGQLPVLAEWKSETELYVGLDETWPEGRSTPTGNVPDAAIYKIDNYGRQLGRSLDVTRVLAISEKFDRAICSYGSYWGDDSKHETWLTDLHGRKLKLLDVQEKGFGGNATIDWSPTQSIAILSRQEEAPVILNFRSNVTRQTFKGPDGYDAEPIVWSADGNRLWFLAKPSGATGFDPAGTLWVRDMATGRDLKIVENVRVGNVNIRDRA